MLAVLACVSVSPVRECSRAWRPFDELTNADVTFQASDDAPIQRSLESRARVGTCRVQTETSEGIQTWYSQRVGPFTSHGGYDWWFVAWDDVGNLSQLIAQSPSRAFGAKEVVHGAVDAEGAPIAFPPLHLHHSHIVGGRDAQSEWLVLGHGDQQCASEHGGTACQQTSFGARALVFDAPPNVAILWNDVRAAGSAPLEWWFEISLRVAPAAQGDGVLSRLSLYDPYTLPSEHAQRESNPQSPDAARAKISLAAGTRRSCAARPTTCGLRGTRRRTWCQRARRASSGTRSSCRRPSRWCTT
jgi:hypothetical protein